MVDEIKTGEKAVDMKIPIQSTQTGPKAPEKTDKVVIIVAFLFIMIIVMSIFLYANYLDYISVLEKKELYAKVIVGDKYGFDVNGTALIFGKIPPGGSTAKREVFITNNYEKPVKVRMNVQGSIKDFIHTSENNFILYPNENKTMVFFVNTPAETPFGTYEGKVTILIQSALIK